MDQAGLYSLAGQTLEVAAWLTEANTLQNDLAHAEFALHQVIERHAAGDEVSPRLARLQSDLRFAGERFQGLDFDECDFAVGIILLGEGAVLKEVTVAGQAAAGDG